MKDKITAGYELPKEAWLSAADNIQEVAPAIASFLRQKNLQGMGKQDAEEFLTDMQLAYIALMYVAEFARDKCRIIPIGK